MNPLDMTEKEWQRQVVDLARNLGYERPMHIYDSRRSEPGWPDLTLVSTQRQRFVLLELKTETGKLSAAQAKWLVDLTMVGIETYVARPRHLDLLATLLQARRPATQRFAFPDPWSSEQVEAFNLLTLERDSLTAKYDIPY